MGYRKAYKLAAGAALLALVLGLAYVLAPSSPAPDRAAGHLWQELSWQTGQSQQYDLRIDSTSLLHFDVNQVPHSLDLQMEGVLDFLPLEVTDYYVQVGMRLSSVEMTIAGQASGDAVNVQLQLPFRVRFARDGRMQAFDFPAGMSGEIRTIVENTVRMFQVVLDEGEQWQVEEVNASGRYSAIYRRLSGVRLEKSKTEYLRVAPGQGDALPTVSSRENIRLGSNASWLVSMEVEESLRTEPELGLASDISNHASLRLRGQGMGSLLASADWEFSAAVAEKQRAAEPQEAALTLEAARQQLDASIGALTAGEGTRRGDIHRLGELLGMHGELVDVVLEQLREDGLDDRTRADLYLALQLAGTPEAQGALNTVAADRSWPAEDSLRAIVALGFVNEPTEETMQQLWQSARDGVVEGEYRDIPATATLALGSIGSGLRARDEASYQDLRTDLLDGANSGSTPGLRAASLLALGNTGDDDPLLAAEIEVFLADPESKVRSAAANSLGRLGPDRVAPALVRSYQQEPSAMVRGSIAKALTAWDAPSESAVASLRTAVEAERDEKARYNLTVVLGNTLENNPENRETLQRMLETERSERIRQEIANSLYGQPP